MYDRSVLTSGFLFLLFSLRFLHGSSFSSGSRSSREGLGIRENLLDLRGDTFRTNGLSRI
jgi:hypothetical protein